MSLINGGIDDALLNSLSNV